MEQLSQRNRWFVTYRYLWLWLITVYPMYLHSESDPTPPFAKSWIQPATYNTSQGWRSREGWGGFSPPPPLWGVGGGGGLSPTTFSEASGEKNSSLWRPWTPASVQSFNGRVSPPTFFFVPPPLILVGGWRSPRVYWLSLELIIHNMLMDCKGEASGSTLPAIQHILSSFSWIVITIPALSVISLIEWKHKYGALGLSKEVLKGRQSSFFCENRCLFRHETY